jgi:hypothetical protein
LRATQQLVAAEADEVDFRGERLAHGRLVGHAPRTQVGERAAAEVSERHQAALARQPRDPLHRHRRREAADLVVAGVHLHQQRRARADGVGVVGKMRAIRRADLVQAGPGTRHDVGHPELPADLDQLAARDDHRTPARPACSAPAAQRPHCC